jgi:hypothetical protein
MKKTILTTVIGLFCSISLNAQIIVQGISPSPIANSYPFTWAQPGGGDWSTPDFNIAGVFVQDTLALADDGTPGVSPNGHNLGNEACNPIINNVAGKIAVIYRGSCEFSLKPLNAQQAGAVAVILINSDNSVIQMGGGANGTGVTIPMVMLTNDDGNALVNEMQNGSVIVFMGNQLGASNNDVGSLEDEVLISPFGGGLETMYNGFDPGLIVYNYGNNVQSNVTLNAQITGPTGIMYDETVGPLTIASGGNESLLPGSTNALPPFDLGAGNYPVGNYTLTYTLDMGVPDEFPVDNIRSFDFSIDSKALSYSRADANGQPIANSYPSNSTTEYQSCAMIQESNFNGRPASGMYYIPHTDTTLVNPIGTQVFGNLYQWDDAWTDLNDPNYQFDPFANDAFQNLNLLTFGQHIIANQNEIDEVGYIAFGTVAPLQNNIRYLFCMQSFEPTVVFGYDEELNYTGGIANSAQPVAPVLVDGSWYVTGWTGFNAPSIAIDLDTTCLNTSVTQLYASNTCIGQNSGEIAIQVSGFNGASVSWDNGGMGDTLTGLPAGTYTATITDTNSCTASISITIVEVQLAAVTQTQNESCDGTLDGSIEITSIIDGTAPISYQWNTGDTTASISGLDDGNYDVIITDANGCQITENFTLTSIPDFGLIATATPDWGASPMQVTFSNGTPSISLYNFTWYFGDGASIQDNSLSVQHTYMIDGTWDVSLVAEDLNTGCVDSVSFNGLVVTNSNVGIDELNLDKTILISPNPCSGIVNVLAKGFTDQIQIEVVTLDGQVIYSHSSFETTNEIDLSSVTPGMYLVKVSDESYQSVERLIKK